MSEADFLEVVTAGQPPAPAYFVYNATLNKQGRGVRSTDAVIPALTDEVVDAALAAGAVLDDARDQLEFAAGHVTGSINVPWDGRMAETIGSVLTPEQRVVIIAPEGQEQEVATRFARIGFDNVLGYVPDPEAYLLAHQDRVQRASRLTTAQVEAAVASDDVQVVDIRNAGELEAGMLPDARHIPLAELARRSGELDPAKPVIVYCAGGWRSSVGASLLRAQGFRDVSDILGGYSAWALSHAIAS
jgi:rhodanese-related sulfurtransferase